MIAKSTVVRLAAAVLLLAGSVAAQAQQAARVYRIGLVSPTSPAPAVFDAFRQTLRELGYVEGRNVIFEARYADEKPERLPELVAELIRLKVDVIVSGSTVGVLAAKKATTTIPIVFATVFDPVGSGIVANLAHPGGNITGVAVGISGVGFGGKWAELLNDAVPNVSQVAVLWNSTNPSSASYVQEVQSAARSLKMKLHLLDAGNPRNLDRAFAAIDASGVQGIIVTADPFFIASRARLVQLAASKRLPAVYFSKLFVDAGGLMAYGASFEDSYRRAATYVDKILKGAKPADLPVEQPTKFELVINLRAAKALGLTIPARVLLRAD
jgi:putative tryptophan/tyrosine transport system substrate-binding protein